MEVRIRMAKENQEKKGWVDDLTKIDVGGNYLTIHNAFKYIFSIDLSKKPKEVDKQYKGKDAGTKYQWHVTLFNFEKVSPSGASYLKEEKPKKYKKIMNLESGQDYILELPKGATKDLAIFIKEKNYDSDQLISMTRTGDGFKTKYHFSIATEEELGYD
jgi:hypothetical protein